MDQSWTINQNQSTVQTKSQVYFNVFFFIFGLKIPTIWKMSNMLATSDASDVNKGEN